MFRLHWDIALYEGGDLFSRMERIVRKNAKRNLMLRQPLNGGGEALSICGVQFVPQRVKIEQHGFYRQI